MVNGSGPRSSGRQMFTSSLNSALMYGFNVGVTLSAAGATGINFCESDECIAGPEIRAVSEPAILTVADSIPLHIMAREWQAIYCRRMEMDREVGASEEVPIIFIVVNNLFLSTESNA